MKVLTATPLAPTLAPLPCLHITLWLQSLMYTFSCIILVNIYDMRTCDFVEVLHTYLVFIYHLYDAHLL